MVVHVEGEDVQHYIMSTPRVPPPFPATAPAPAPPPRLHIPFFFSREPKRTKPNYTKPNQQYLVEKRDQVLVRLKVEHSDFPTLNNQRFGSQFMGKV